jgi:hypothetical protein
MNLPLAIQNKWGDLSMSGLFCKATGHFIKSPIDMWKSYHNSDLSGFIAPIHRPFLENDCASDLVVLFSSSDLSNTRDNFVFLEIWKS